MEERNNRKVSADKFSGTQQAKVQQSQEVQLRKDIQQHEDIALKTGMQFFAEELLPYFKISGKVVSFAPTELVHLEVQKLNQDFNLVMEDGTWKHFEFQSTNEGLAGLKRFRTYEALTSYQYKVEVTTYVLYSGSIQNPMTEFTEGANTYRVIPIIMRDKNADQLIAGLQRKAEAGEALTRQDLVPLTLCPLMGGSLSQKERIRAAYGITRRATQIPKEDIRKIEAMIYTMADKFLESADIKEIEEEISMTRLGQMLVNRGIEQERVNTERERMRADGERMRADDERQRADAAEAENLRLTEEIRRLRELLAQ